VAGPSHGIALPEVELARSRLLIWVAAVAVTAPAAFAAGMLAFPDDPAATSPESLPTAGAHAQVAGLARADGLGGVREVKSEKLRLASYDPRTGKAKLAGAQGRPTVKTGDVIASGSTPRLPKGALVKVTDPRPDASGAVSVQPATLPELLGDRKINSTTPVNPAGISIKPLVNGVTGVVTPAAGPVAPAARPQNPAARPGTPAAPAPAATSKALGTAGPAAEKIAPAPLPASGVDGRHNVGGQLKLDLAIPLAKHGFRPTKQGGPTLSGWVHFQPQVIFSYQRDHALGLAPSKAAIGLGGAYDYGWKVHASLPGKFDTGRLPLRLPFAEVHVSTTLFVAGFPVVVDVDLTYFYQVTASGQISIDTEQKTAGNVSLGAQYDQTAGWSQLPLATATTTPGKALTVHGTATTKATIGAQLKVALYGTVGALLEWAPYLRADIESNFLLTNWALYAGFELRGALFVQLKIFGIPIFDKTFYLPPLNGEWRVAGSLIPPKVPQPATITPPAADKAA